MDRWHYFTRTNLHIFHRTETWSKLQCAWEDRGTIKTDWGLRKQHFYTYLNKIYKSQILYYNESRIINNETLRVPGKGLQPSEVSVNRRSDCQYDCKLKYIKIKLYTITNFKYNFTHLCYLLPAKATATQVLYSGFGYTCIGDIFRELFSFYKITNAWESRTVRL